MRAEQDLDVPGAAIDVLGVAVTPNILASAAALAAAPAP